jgi:hypothetical protein
MCIIVEAPGVTDRVFGGVRILLTMWGRAYKTRSNTAKTHKFKPSVVFYYLTSYPVTHYSLCKSIPAVYYNNPEIGISPKL